MFALDSKEIYVSTGSACHSGSLEASPTVKSFKLPPEYEHGTIRISFDENLTPHDIEYFTDELARICNILSCNK
jgi:cysteine desulfurase